jgi:hypothetical protein
VLNPLRGSAVRRAEVFLGPPESPQAHRALADATGHYKFTGMKPGRYRLSGQRPGFWPAGQWLTLSDCQSVREVDLMLQAAAAIAGRVYDEDGGPLLVNVQLWRETWKHGFRELSEVTRQPTEDGFYRFFGLAPGRYHVSTVQMPIQDVRQAYDQTFYPSPIQLAAGGEADDIDFHLRRTPTVTLGLNIQGTFAPDQFVSIDLENPDNHAKLHLATNDHNFEIDGLTTGSYQLTATSRYEDRRYYALMNIDVGTVDIRALPVQLTPALEVQAKLQFQGEHPPPSDSAARLDGRVQFPDTVDKVRVILVGTEVEKNAGTGSDGTYLLKGIAPGQYTLISVEEDEDQNWRNPEILRALTARGVRVDLAPGATVHRDLTLTR